MKKVLAVLITFILTNNIFADRTYFDFKDFFKAKYILNVSKKILDVSLNEFSIAYLSNEECRLLRNSIFYYHGYKFKSEDLIEYFNNYYSLDTEDSEKTSQKELSETDNKNVKLFQLYEKREEKTEAELQKTKISDEYVGAWYLESFIVGNDTSACLLIEKDNTFSLSPLFNGGSSNFRHYSGKIYISNKTMYLYIDSIIFCSEGRMGYFNPLYNYNAKKDSYTMTLDHPMVLSFPITLPERSEATILGPNDEEVLVDKYIHMNLGSMIFFKEEK